MAIVANEASTDLGTAFVTGESWLSKPRWKPHATGADTGTLQRSVPFSTVTTLGDPPPRKAAPQPPFSTSRDRLINLVEKLQKKQFDVVEELITSKRTMNTAVQVCSVDGTILHQEPSIRKLKKNSGADPIVEEALSKAIRYTPNGFSTRNRGRNLRLDLTTTRTSLQRRFFGRQLCRTTEPAKTVLQEMKTNIMDSDVQSIATKHVVEETSSSSQMKLNFDDFNDFDNETEKAKPATPAYTFSMDEDF